MRTTTKLQNEIGRLQSVLAAKNQVIADLNAKLSKAQLDITERDAMIKELKNPTPAAA